MRSLMLPTLVLVVPFALACGVRESPSAGVADGAQISDSAGVTVITNPAPEPNAPTFKLSPSWFSSR